MKQTIIFIILLGLTTCKIQTTKNQSVSTENDSTEVVQYSESELISFLDSIGKLNPNSWVEELLFMVDSTLNNQAIFNHELTVQQFEKLKKAVKEELIDFDFAKQIFPKLEVDTTEWRDKLPIEFHSFDKSETNFEKFAILIGYGGGFSWDNDVYFFYKRKVIAKHSIYHRYGLDLKHFKDENNQTIIFYKVNYQSGSGIWWHQFNFYRYNDDQLFPILTEIQNINLQFPWSIRGYWIESKIVNERPLQIKFVYNNQFYDGSEIDVPWDFPTRDFINDSTIVTYRIDTQSGKYIPDFNGTKQNRNKLTSYFLSDKEQLFANAHYDLFKKKLNEKNDTIMRNAILNYLNDLKNGLEKQ